MPTEPHVLATKAGIESRQGRLDRASTVPVWRQLERDLRARLESGGFAASFPGELELAEQYAVSRHTVREALRQLRADGTITSGRGRRPKIAATVIAQPTGVAYSLFSSVEAAGLSQISVVRVKDIRADGVIATRLGLEESTPLFHLERLRLAGDEPLALDRVWLPAAIAEPLLATDFRRTSLYDELLALTGIPITGGEETVRATVPTAAERDVLKLGAPAAVFAVERTATSSGVPVEWRHTLIRADRFWLTNQLVGRPAPGSLETAVTVLSLSPGIR